MLNEIMSFQMISLKIRLNIFCVSSADTSESLWNMVIFKSILPNNIKYYQNDSELTLALRLDEKF